MQQYDIASKVLIDTCRDDIIRYLLDIPVRESRILDPLPQETVSLKRGDYPVMITDETGARSMVIIEIYTQWERPIPPCSRPWPSSRVWFRRRCPRSSSQGGKTS